MVEFVSYDGKFPNLCRGTLILKIDGKEVTFPYNCMTSGGRVWFSSDWEGHVESEPWSVEIPEEYLKCAKEITDVVNNNVRHGCCGGGL